MGSFTVQHGYRTQRTGISIGVRCVDPNGCAFNITAAKSTFAKKSLNEVTQSMVNDIKWYRFCVTDNRGLEVISRMSHPGGDGIWNVTRLGFFVSRSRVDQPKVMGYGTQSPANWSISGNSLAQNGFREPYWLNPGFDLLNATNSSVTQFTEEKLDLCPWTPGFSIGAFYVGVFVKCTDPDSWMCYSSSHLVPYTIMATSVEKSCSTPLVSNMTVPSIVHLASTRRS